jgi:hypothetical protein
MNDRQSIAALLERTSRVLEGRLTPPQIDYIFDPHDDMSLREVIELLKILRVSASSDEYLHPDFPQLLKRHFRPGK